MTFNTISMIQQKVKIDFDDLVATVTGPAGQQSSADQMERHLFKQLLQLGAELMQLYLDVRSQAYPRQEAVNQAGVVLPYHSERQRDYVSIFGKLALNRPYFYRKEVGGYSPLDAVLGLGADSYSDFLRELHEELGVQVAFDKTVGLLGRLLDLHLSKRCLQAFIETDAADVAAYYEQRPPPPVAEEAAILVVQADGKGVPMVKASQSSQKVRLKRGEARSRKKAVVVTSLYTIQPAPRTVDEVLATLVNEEKTATDQPKASRHQPQHKQLWGTLAGKPAALDRLHRQVAKRDGNHIQHRVMLCDGDKSLQEHLLARFADFTLILDFIHAYEYLWQVASALYGQDHPDRLPWVQQQTRCLLNGQALALVESLRQLAQAEGRSKSQQKILTKVANYFERNQPYMDYATYLKAGWPIASGVIEGACRHFVKDRMELSGMRWSQNGAENLLHLRAVAENGDWDAYHRFRQQQRQQRLYGCDWPPDVDLLTPRRLMVSSATTQPSIGRNASSTHVNQIDCARLPLAA